jgi:hypothetical protein
MRKLVAIVVFMLAACSAQAQAFIPKVELGVGSSYRFMRIPNASNRADMHGLVIDTTANGLLSTVPGDIALLACGPLSLVLATVLGWASQECLAGWWLLGGGAATAVLSIVQIGPEIHGAPRSSVTLLFLLVAIFALPMCVCGALLLKYVAAKRAAAKPRPGERLFPFTYKGKF